MPTFCSPPFVLERKREDSIALLHSVFPFSVIGLEGGIDGIKGGGGGESICRPAEYLVGLWWEEGRDWT